MKTLSILALPHVMADADWSGVFSNASNQIWPFVLNFVIPIILIVFSILLLLDIVKAVTNYRRGDDVQIIPLVLLVAGIALLLALQANNGALLKSLVGLS